MTVPSVRKAAILAGGYGTRFLPGTKSVPKELFALLDTPAIQYIVDELREAGITQILVVTSRRKPALAAYFDRDVELEMVFTAEGATDKLAKIQPIDGVHFYYYPQLAMKGTGDALLCLEEWSHGEPFVVAYPDDIVMTDTGAPGLTAQLIETYSRTGLTVLAGKEIDGDVSRYGVVGYETMGGCDLVTAMIEKPPRGTEPSKVVSFGRYLYTSEIFTALRKARELFDGRGELTQTHGLQHMLDDRLISLCRFNGTVLDVGTPAGYLRATLEMGLRRPEFRELTLAMLRELGAREGIFNT